MNLTSELRMRLLCEASDNLTGTIYGINTE